MSETDDHREQQRHERRMYGRFALMIATSTVVMFALMYTNVFAVGHVRWSEERFYMALLMAGAMALVMFAFMRSAMYRNRTYNALLVGLALALGAGGLVLSRTQVLVDDRAYMRGMIPHHSIAILTSERADIDDVRVRELADQIAATQRREIREMDWLIDDIGRNGTATTQEEAEQRPIPDFSASSILDHDRVSAVLALLGIESMPTSRARPTAGLEGAGHAPER